MSKLITLNDQNINDILNDVLNDEIIVYEDIQGSKIWVNWNGTELNIKPKSLSSDIINIIDLATQNYYNKAFNYLNGLDHRVKSLLNRKWWFCFEYFPDNQPANVEYNIIPKNNLVLTHINKGGNKYTFCLDELNEYSRLLDVDIIPIIFKGKITDKMKEAIKYFLNTSEEDLEYIFGEKSFAYFFYKILNPSSKNSFMMVDDNFQKNVEKLIIKTSKDNISFELLNPLYSKISIDNDTEFLEVYTLILVNFLNFTQSINLNDIKLKGNTKNEVYIYLISKLYNIYISEIKEDILNFNFIIPDFFDKEKFRINTELIPNKLTLDYIKEDPKLEYIFKIILGSFNKKKKKPIGIFSETTIILFNKLIDNINELIDLFLGKMREGELIKSKLLNFGDFFEIKYDTDGEGNVYPDIYNEFEKEKITTNKSKKNNDKKPSNDNNDSIKNKF